MNKILFVFVWVVFTAGIALAEPAVTVRETIVRAEPGNQSAQVVVLAVGEKVEIQTRQGGWYQITFQQDQSGWLPLLSIRKEGAGTPKKAKSSGLKSLFSSYRTGSSGVTVATGVRGLDAVDLKNSKPNMQELGRIDQYISSDDEARDYAAHAGLVSRDVAWIKVNRKGEVMK